jgi:hypothetical protein
VLPDGRVVVVGGFADDEKGFSDEEMKSVEVYEPESKAFRLVPDVLKDGVAWPFVAPLEGSRVLLGGGSPRAAAGTTTATRRRASSSTRTP